eukprot:307969_1
MVLELLLLFTLVSNSFAANIFDPRVYNYYFYVTTNSDIISANITTEQKAANHWQNVGIFEGRQACGSFHVLQFLDNYPNLAKKYGTNYTAAIDYYLQPNGGYDQHLLGYTIGGGYARYTLGNVTKGLYISGSLRMAGAIDSLVWNNTEFVNNWGHGRQLQIAVHNDSGACFNPTEAGTYNDWQSNVTTSILLNISTTNINKFESCVLPAFWTLPGQPDVHCSMAVNQWNVSNFTMMKSISFLSDKKYSLNGKYNVIEFNVSIYVPYDMSYLFMEAPSAYLPMNFDTFYGVNMTKDSNGNYDLINFEIPDTGGHNFTSGNIPVMIASNDSNYALGIVSKQMPYQYGLYNFIGVNPDSKASSKWNAQQKFYNLTAKTWLHFNTYLCVGNLNDVKDCMINIYAQ